MSYESVAAPKSIVAIGEYGVSDSLGQVLGKRLLLYALNVDGGLEKEEHAYERLTLISFGAR